MMRIKTVFLFLTLIALSVTTGCQRRPQAVKEQLEPSTDELALENSESSDQTQPLLSEEELASPSSTLTATAPSTSPSRIPSKMNTSSLPSAQQAPVPAQTVSAFGYVKPSIEKIQQALKNAGLYTGTVDGKIGPKTKQAIRNFQGQNNLAKDGRVGPKTWVKLSAYLEKPQDYSSSNMTTASTASSSTSN